MSSTSMSSGEGSSRSSRRPDSIRCHARGGAFEHVIGDHVREHRKLVAPALHVAVARGFVRKLVREAQSRTGARPLQDRLDQACRDRELGDRRALAAGDDESRQSREIGDAAHRAHQSGAHRFCIVISGRGATDRELDDVARAVRAVKADVPIEVCCSLGLLDFDKAQRLKQVGVDRVNHNLNTSEGHYETICTTHTYADRVATVKAVQTAGLSTCSGVLAGMGESDQDLMDVARALRALRVDSVPVNFLNAIPGTPLAEMRVLTPWRCLKILCLFRFLLPKTEIRVAGGREVNLRSLQPLALYPGNSLFINGYLTTGGQSAAEAVEMVRDLGFELDPMPSLHTA